MAGREQTQVTDPLELINNVTLRNFLRDTVVGKQEFPLKGRDAVFFIKQHTGIAGRQALGLHSFVIERKVMQLDLQLNERKNPTYYYSKYQFYALCVAALEVITNCTVDGRYITYSKKPGYPQAFHRARELLVNSPIADEITLSSPDQKKV